MTAEEETLILLVDDRLRECNEPLAGCKEDEVFRPWVDAGTTSVFGLEVDEDELEVRSGAVSPVVVIDEESGGGAMDTLRLLF